LSSTEKKYGILMTFFFDCPNTGDQTGKLLPSGAVQGRTDDNSDYTSMIGRETIAAICCHGYDINPCQLEQT
jgi:hypothetical protein